MAVQPYGHLLCPVESQRFSNILPRVRSSMDKLLAMIKTANSSLKIESESGLRVRIHTLVWACAFTVVLVGCAGATATTQPERPSERRCLVAWNSPANQAVRSRVLELRRWKRGLLVSSSLALVAFGQTVQPSNPLAPVCSLVLVTDTRAQQLVGVWKNGRVTRWLLGASLPSSNSFTSNVRVLSDGRITKIYRTG
jgi:hypothetical protein